MTRDVFISYAAGDRATADSVVQGLEQAGISCWTAPRDIDVGESYGRAIIGAIRECRVMVVVFSAESNDSPHVMNEIERAFNLKKVIMPFRIENIEPSEDIEYFLSRPHWLDAHQGNLADNIQRLVAALHHTIARLKARSAVLVPQPVDGEDEVTELRLTYAAAEQGGNRKIEWSGKHLPLAWPPGVTDGSSIVIAGEGEPGKDGGKPGDLRVTLRVDPPPPERGKDRDASIRLSYAQALAGVSAFKLEGSQVEFDVPAGIESGNVFVVHGAGEPGTYGGDPGDLCIEVLVDAPPPERGSDLRSLISIPHSLAHTGGQFVANVRAQDVRVAIPPSTKTGDNVRIVGQGDPGAFGGPAGDLIFDIGVVPPEPVKGRAVNANLSLSAQEAQTGVTRQLDTAGRRMSVKVAPGARNGQVITIPGAGHAGEHGGPNGDLLVTLSVAALEPKVEHVPRSPEPPGVHQRTPRRRPPVLVVAAVLVVIAVAALSIPRMLGSSNSSSGKPPGPISNLSSTGDPIDTALAAVEAKVNAQDLDRAFQEAQALMSAYSTDARGPLALGLVYEKEHKWQQAEDAFNRSVKLSPTPAGKAGVERVLNESKVPTKICTETHLMATPYCPSTTTQYISVLMKPKSCPRHDHPPKIETECPVCHRKFPEKFKFCPFESSKVATFQIKVW